jgi:hypothetical protein
LTRLAGSSSETCSETFSSAALVLGFTASPLRGNVVAQIQLWRLGQTATWPERRQDAARIAAVLASVAVTSPEHGKTGRGRQAGRLVTIQENMGTDRHIPLVQNPNEGLSRGRTRRVAPRRWLRDASPGASVTERIQIQLDQLEQAGVEPHQVPGIEQAADLNRVQSENRSLLRTSTPLEHGCKKQLQITSHVCTAIIGPTPNASRLAREYDEYRNGFICEWHSNAHVTQSRGEDDRPQPRRASPPNKQA